MYVYICVYSKSNVTATTYMYVNNLDVFPLITCFLTHKYFIRVIYGQ